jgi:DMSO/TMAO reductase YedYZ molybdopterin-dependent catalytic subunit
MKKLFAFFLLFLFLSACSAVPSATPAAGIPPTIAATITATLPPAATITPTQSPTSAPTPTQAAGQACNPQPIVVPTRPPITPQTNQLDETTGLHMTGIVQQLDLATYRLKVSGKVDHPLSLTLDELRCLPKVTSSPVLACGYFFKDIVSWSGTPILEVLKLAGVQAGAKTIILTGADEYTASIALEDALKPQNYLAYEWEGQSVPILHGFPLRAVFPDFGGWAWVKWLVGIEVK